MWTDSESRLSDFDRVTLLVRTHVRFSLAGEAGKSWLDLERDFLEADYRTIRDRQMELSEREDGLFARSSIKQLKEKMGQEAYDLVTEQR
jgi:engulfment/cell motility protein 1